MNPSSALNVRAERIKLLAMDIDGVLTAGEIMYLSNGEEMKVFNAKDGHGLWMAQQGGILTALITGRNSPINERRAKELGIPYLFQGIKKKRPVLEQIMAEHGLGFEQVAYMGDDLPDLDVLEVVGLPCCPADAVPEVKQACAFISQLSGGRGAIRELVDLLLHAQGKHPKSLIREQYAQ